MQINITRGDIPMMVEYDFDEPDRSVGYPGAVTVEAIYVGDHNIIEIVSDKEIDNISQDIFERI